MSVVRSKSSGPDPSSPRRPSVEPSFAPLFARAHKRALGVAVGLPVGGLLFVLTALHVALQLDGPRIELLNQYFYGYHVTWTGAFIGFAWGFVTGFIAGWLLGFVHNFTVGMWMFLIRTRDDLKRTKNFLDHI